MKIKLTFNPSPIEALVIRRRWLESQILPDVLALFRLPVRQEITAALKRDTLKLLEQARTLWQENKVTHAGAVYGEHPEYIVTCTDTPTPALHFFHARLSMEVAHYQHALDVLRSKSLRAYERQRRRERLLLPSWNTKKKNYVPSKTIDWHPPRIKVFDSVAYITDSLINIIFAMLVVSLISSTMSYFIINQDQIIYNIAQMMVRGGLPFPQALASLGIAIYVLASFSAVFLLVLIPHNKITPGEIYENLQEIKDTTAERLAEIYERVDTLAIPRDELCPYSAPVAQDEIQEVDHVVGG